jgi:hypothetical protein
MAWRWPYFWTALTTVKHHRRFCAARPCRGRTSQIQRDSRVIGITLDSGHADDRDEQIREVVGRLLAVFPYDVESHALAARKGGEDYPEATVHDSHNRTVGHGLVN